jgi:hypothetical protein
MRIIRNGLIAKYLGIAEAAILMNFSNLVYVLISYSLATYICLAATAYRRLRDALEIGIEVY